MAIATYRGERSVGEITDKLYTKLTPAQREKAETALIKANPQLKNIRKLPQGAILRVPDMPELRAKTTRSLENPDDQIVKHITQSLAAFSKHLGGQVSAEQESIKQQGSLLKSAKFKKDIAAAEGLQALAQEAGKTLGERSSDIGARQKKVDQAIKQVAKDFEKGFL
jgi:hypothetical protein